jgi:hypothetical protein
MDLVKQMVEWTLLPQQNPFVMTAVTAFSTVRAHQQSPYANAAMLQRLAVRLEFSASVFEFESTAAAQ